MIVAKAVIPNQYWILQQDDRKIGNIEAASDGFTVVINGSQHKFKTLRTMRNKVAIICQDLSSLQRKILCWAIPQIASPTTECLMCRIVCLYGRANLDPSLGTRPDGIWFGKGEDGDENSVPR